LTGFLFLFFGDFNCVTDIKIFLLNSVVASRYWIKRDFMTSVLLTFLGSMRSTVVPYVSVLSAFFAWRDKISSALEIYMTCDFLVL
jgi:hypothetical protein